MLRISLSLTTLAAILWTVGLVAFIQAIPVRSSDPDMPTDAIVVLTGGEGRLAYGFRLLSEGKAKTLFISGVGEGVTKQELLKAYAEGGYTPERAAQLVLDYAASNTLNNARQTALFMEEYGYTSLRLVTAGYHMPRSLWECRRAMPQAWIVPDPVSPTAFRRDLWWKDNTTRKIVLSEYHKYWLAHLREWSGGAIS